MGKKIRKGAYGYRNYLKRKQLFWVLLLAAAIAAQITLRHFTGSHSIKVLSTISAVLTAIPMANLMAPLIAVLPYKTPSPEFHEAYVPLEDRLSLFYDLIITTEKDVIPVEVMAVHPTGIYCLSKIAQDKASRAEISLNQTLRFAHLDPNLHLLTERKQFDRRLEQLKPEKEYPDDGTMKYAKEVILGMSM